MKNIKNLVAIILACVICAGTVFAFATVEADAKGLDQVQTNELTAPIDREVEISFPKTPHEGITTPDLSDEEITEMEPVDGTTKEEIDGYVELTPIEGNVGITIPKQPHPSIGDIVLPDEDIPEYDPDKDLPYDEYPTNKDSGVIELTPVEGEVLITIPENPNESHLIPKQNEERAPTEEAIKGDCIVDEDLEEVESIKFIPVDPEIIPLPKQPQPSIFNETVERDATT